MAIQGRKYTGSTGYRYGMNGQEKDDEVYGAGNLNTAEFWEYDTRLGRRWNLDPKPNASISNYACFANNPIWYKDALGDTIVMSIFSNAENQDVVLKLVASNLVLNQKNDGVFIIMGHADPDGFENNSGKLQVDISTPTALFKLLKTNKDWNDAKKDKKPITLILAGCNTATEPKDYFEDDMQGHYDKSITQRVSEKDKEITVRGLDGYLIGGRLTEDKKNTIGRKGNWGIMGVEGIKENNAGLVTYVGGKKTGKKVIGAEALPITPKSIKK
jgi:hypothetical protein